jgi:hypothetical protein
VRRQVELALCGMQLFCNVLGRPGASVDTMDGFMSNVRKRHSPSLSAYYTASEPTPPSVVALLEVHSAISVMKGAMCLFLLHQHQHH